MTTEKKPFEDECHTLAEAVLDDEMAFYNKADLRDLTAELQCTIENWVNRKNSEDGPRETGDAWTGGFADNH